jgi:hypothetical protein
MNRSLTLIPLALLLGCSPNLSPSTDDDDAASDDDVALEGVAMAGAEAWWIETRSFQGSPDGADWIGQYHQLLVTDIPDLCTTLNDAYSDIAANHSQLWEDYWLALYSDPVAFCGLFKELVEAAPALAALEPTGGQKLSFAIDTSSLENGPEATTETTGLPVSGTYGADQLNGGLIVFEEGLSEFLEDLDCEDPASLESLLAGTSFDQELSGAELNLQVDGEVAAVSLHGQLDDNELSVEGDFVHCVVQLPDFPDS